MAVTLNSRYPSPLRYPGGKGKIANYIKLLLLKNDLVGSEYVEPYAGGANVALSLLYEDFVNYAHINDLNRSVWAFWRTALDQPDELCAKIMDTSVTVEEWQRQHAVQDDDDATVLELAFSTFFLNRTNRSGIISRGGLIGGKDQRGNWKIDARYDKQGLCTRIQKIARFRTRIELTQLDAADLIQQLGKHDETERFVYLDPPYYVKGRGLYDNFYNHTDHETIGRLVRQMRSPWIVSYDAVPEIFNIYDFARPISYSLIYTASNCYQGSEVMFFSPDLDIPNLKSAAGVTASDVNRARLCALNV